MKAGIDLGNIVINAELSGRGETSIILIHELGGSLHSFDAMATLLEKNFRLLRYDQRGAGGSEKPPGGITLENHVNDLKALIKWAALPPPYIILAAAAGATIALQYALSPEAPIDRLILCAPAISMPPARRDELRARARDVATAGMRSIVDRTLAKSFPDILRQNHIVYESYRTRFLANDALMYAQAVTCAAETEFGEKLEKLKTPCLVVAGIHDLVRPVTLITESVAALPNKHVRLIESGHLMAVQAPNILYKIIEDWLSQKANLEDNKI